jgi:2-hydroxychromene-2-carboxylate isomerase
MSDAEPVTLQVFYGMSSPWAYMGAERIAKVAAGAGVPMVLRPIRIIEANGGIPLRTRPDARQKYHVVELRRWSSFLGIPLNIEPRFYPCRSIEPAAQAVIAAQRAGLDAKTFSFAIQRALWAEERDIADLDTLRALARETIGQAGADLVLDEQPASIVDEWQGNLAEAERLGIFGTPTYVIGTELFWGQDRIDFVACALGALQAQSKLSREHA